MKYAVNSTKVADAFGPYTQGNSAARFVFTSGQIGLDPKTGLMVPGGVDAQTEQAIRNAEAIISEVGCSLSDVVKATVYLADMNDFESMNEVYARLFPAPYPARTAVEVAALPKGALVEIECIACR